MVHKNKGLTLIEVLVVVTILSVLTLTLYTVFKSGADAWSKSETRLDIYQNARVVLDQISRELAGAIVGESAANGARFVGIDADPDTIEFVTNFAGSLYRIRYERLAGTTRLQRSYEENPADFNNPAYTNIEFNELTNDIQFTYWIASASSVPSWDSWGGPPTTDRLPRAVTIILTLVDPEGNTYRFETMAYLPNSDL